MYVCMYVCMYVWVKWVVDSVRVSASVPAWAARWPLPRRRWRGTRPSWWAGSPRTPARDGGSGWLMTLNVWQYAYKSRYMPCQLACPCIRRGRTRINHIDITSVHTCTHTYIHTQVNTYMYGDVDSGNNTLHHQWYIRTYIHTYLVLPDFTVLRDFNFRVDKEGQLLLPPYRCRHTIHT